MLFSPFEIADLSAINAFQPEGWDDLTTTFTYFIQSPHCHPIKLSIDNQIVAIGASLRHIDTAWLACIVVHPSYRGNGLGRAITKELIERLDPRIYKTVYLDATDAGFPVYTQLGFQIEDEYLHYKKALNTTAALPFSQPNIRPYEEKDFHQVFQLDYKATGEHRKGILNEWLKEGVVFEDNGFIQGYYLPKISNKPIIARSRPVGKALLQYHSERYNTVITPSTNEYTVTFLEENGFEIYRRTKRMRMGIERQINLQMVFNRLSGQLG